LVLVSVKAPQHREAAMAAIEAGKAVCVEWPMGANLAESEALAAAALSAGVRSFVVLQARAAPPVVHALELIRRGYLGRPISAAIQGSYSYWGDPVASGYSADVRNGANVLTIPGGHGLDLLTHLMGPITDLSARDTHLRQTAMATDLGHSVPVTSPDQFACIGSLASGALLSAHFVGAAARGEYFRLYLAGDEGELLLEGQGMPEIAALTLTGTNDPARPLAPIVVPASTRTFSGARPDGPAWNIAHFWGDILDDLAQDTRKTPDFEQGLQSRKVVDAIAQASLQTGSSPRLDAAQAPIE
jgi:predicted dehydrogenase